VKVVPVTLKGLRKQHVFITSLVYTVFNWQVLDLAASAGVSGTVTIDNQTFNVEGQAFLYRMVAIDKTWVRDFGPELKSQSNEWRSPNFPSPKKFWRAQSKVKQMIFAYDRVPRGISVTAVYYRDWLQKLRRKMHNTWPDLLGDGPLILHDSARSHLGKVVTNLLSKYEWEVLPHMPFSPDMSPPDFILFHKLKESMCGDHFPSLEEVSSVVTWASRGLNKSGTLNGISNLLKHWDAVIEKQDCNEILRKIKYICK
jgi:hypothetical protein